MKQYQVRCDKSIIKQAFLKGSRSPESQLMKMLQKKFNIKDRMISPFIELPMGDQYDERFATKILEAEKTIKA